MFVDCEVILDGCNQDLHVKCGEPVEKVTPSSSKVCRAGKAGPKGPPGQRGLQGDKGEQGDQGLTGHIGVKGEKGEPNRECDCNVINTLLQKIETLESEYKIQVSSCILKFALIYAHPSRK